VLSAEVLEAPIRLPFRIMAQTDRSDFEQQCALIAALSFDVVASSDAPWFYRVATD
jgi:hypothetical protein